VTDFHTASALFGALLICGSLISGVARRTFLALAPLFVLVGFALGSGGLRVLRFAPGSGFVEILASTALIVILFRDGLEVEQEMLSGAWHLPLRKLVIGMPITAAIVAVAARALLGLSWIEAFLLGALLSPDGRGAVLRGRDESAGAARHPAFAEPRVRAQRRACPGARHRAEHGSDRPPWTLRVVEVRFAGSRRRALIRPSGRLSCEPAVASTRRK
jgi:hypothetical protein